MSIELTETEPGVTITDYQIERAERKRDKLRETLSRHSGLLGKDLVEMIADNEYSLFIDDALKDRKEGKVNDDRSESIGIIALLTKESVLGIKEASDKLKYPLGEGQLKEDDSFVTLRLDNGLYRYGGGGIRFFTEVKDPNQLWSEEQESAPSFKLGSNLIIRVRGDKGELWQNQNYTWEGEPKQNKLPQGGWYIAGPASGTQ
ncbi:MAG: hypothetical protein Q7T54_04425 [Candidatus Levybacteria bacterium]|nr:hypothetical protein [Candidatus Levybacteria bacterium]